MSSGPARRVPAHPLLLFAFLLAGAGCGPVPPPGPPQSGGEAPPAEVDRGQGPGGRSQRLVLTPEQEVTLGKKAYAEVLSKSKVLPADRPEVRRVRRVGEPIEKASEIEPLQREINLHLEGYHFEWAYNVLEDRHINAFCMPGGKVAVFTGLLPVVQNDDQLATVMSHEIAHALAHHANERIAREQLHETALKGINGALGEIAPERRKLLIGALAAGAELYSLKYDRRQESEADHIGLFLMTFAGYDPEQAAVFWQRMEKATGEGGKPPAILSDHPSDARRLEQIREWIPRAKAAKQAYDQGRVAPGSRRER